MPFEVFRRHQRKLIAIFAILAMGGFVLSDSLPALLRGGASAGETAPIVKLKDRTISRRDLNRLAIERTRANQFMALLYQAAGEPSQPITFGGTREQDLVDAYILEAEADRLGMPATPDIAARLLREATPLRRNPALFDTIYRQHFSKQVTDEALLVEIANQIRLLKVATLPLPPGVNLLDVTPLDIFQAYRDQYEKVSAYAVPFAVEEAITRVPDPASGEIEAFYDRYKSTLPDPDRDTPGFMIPRRIRIEAVWGDQLGLAETIRGTLTDNELREVFKQREAEFPLPPPELPTGLFAGEPNLTPKVNDSFLEVRDEVARVVSQERAREQLDEKFEKLKSEVMNPFSDRYDEAVEANALAKETGGAIKSLPEPEGLLKPLAEQLGLNYEQTPLITMRELMERKPLGQASQGGGALGGGRTISQILFQARSMIYDVYELADLAGHRFLLWKLEDVEAKTPPLDQIRDQVVRAWKLEKARDLVQREAQAFADQVKAAGGGEAIKKMAGDRRLIVTEPRTNLQQYPFMAMSMAPRESEITELPQAGPELRRALFGLEPSEVAVAPNAPKTVYYVLSLAGREAASFDQLTSPQGPYITLRMELAGQEAVERMRGWMQSLRDRAGLPRDWVPSDQRSDGDLE
jgi:peptidyl-prolyl cis-trans isomerase D